MVVMTREGVPVYMRDIAEVKDATEQRRSFMRINGKPGVQLQVQKQSGKNTVAVAHGVRAEVERVNRGGARHADDRDAGQRRSSSSARSTTSRSTRSSAASWWC